MKRCDFPLELDSRLTERVGRSAIAGDGVWANGGRSVRRSISVRFDVHRDIVHGELFADHAFDLVCNRMRFRG